MKTTIQSFRTACLISLFLLGELFFAQGQGGEATPGALSGRAHADPLSVLSTNQRRQLEQSVDRALAWIATKQQPDGSFPTHETGQPAVTALCLMAFMARGHVPSEGKYGEQLERAIDYILSCQKNNGLLANVLPHERHRGSDANSAAIYNHAIGGLALSESYGMTDPAKTRRIRLAIEKALAHTYERQKVNEHTPRYKGGWRYHTHNPGFSGDLSVTAWQIQFLRSSRNAGLDVPEETIDTALAFVERCFDAGMRTFAYAPQSRYRFTRAMAGAGILSLAFGGQHESPMAETAARWLLRNPLLPYNVPIAHNERYHYAVYYCVHGMFQMGGSYWEGFFPPLVEVLLANQNADGSWKREPSDDNYFGNVYTTAITTLGLCTPYQLLPILQR